MRIILPKEQIKGQRITISGEKARYLISVLRCNAGDELQVFDGEGSFYKSRISGIDNKEVKIDLLEKIPFDTESPLNLILIQGILKGDKMDWVIQKATELGVKEIIPAITERGQIRETRKAARWRKIAEEASRQSGRTMIPVVHEPIEFKLLLAQDVIARSVATKQSHQSEIALLEPALSDKARLLRSARNDKSEGAHNDTRKTLKGFIFWEEGGLSLKEAFQKIKTQNADTPPNPTLDKGGHGGVNSQLFVAIGPEGGFTKEEVRLAESRGLIATSLGKRILRAETAAISAVTLVQFLMGDI
ncbi:MAG: RsmE family RNA methyltransferase [Nitrospirota bacterium]